MGAKYKAGQQTYPEGFPEPMRLQLWPLCCGVAILSGFKDIYGLDVPALTTKVEETLNTLPDFQVYAGEQMMPKLTFLTLNQGQTGSPKIMEAVTKAGFVLIGTARPRGGQQSFFVRDQSKSWKPAAAA